MRHPSGEPGGKDKGIIPMGEEKGIFYHLWCPEGRKNNRTHVVKDGLPSLHMVTSDQWVRCPKSMEHPVLGFPRKRGAMP